MPHFSKRKSATGLHEEPIAELRSVTCHMGSHSATCHPTQVNAPHLNPSQTDRYSIYLPRRDEGLSWPWCWLYIEIVYLSTDSHGHRSYPLDSDPTGSQT